MHPKQVFFILTYELLERFAYYSIKSVTVLYLSEGLGYSEHLTTAVFHSLISIAYVLPLAGAWIADSWMGKFRTIAYLSSIYILGTIFVMVSSLDLEDNYVKRSFALIGLCLIAVGNGGVKPCVMPFGADQYYIPDQEKELNTFFSLFYWFINVGGLFACFFAPYIRSNVQCLGYDTCYSLVFGISVFTIVMAVSIFCTGRSWYLMRPVEHAAVNKFFECIGHGLLKTVKSHEKREHWLDVADDKFPANFIEDVKTVLDVFLVLLPTVTFWALNDKQSSRWIFQAKQMDGRITSSFKIEPDQMVMISAFFVLPSVPLFVKVIYPCLERIGLLKSFFKKMYVGEFIMSGTSLLAAFLQCCIKHYKEQKYTLHIAWQIPQYMSLVVAEIMFVINGTSFVYRQSPPNMESLVTSLWLLMISLGNFIAFVVASFRIPSLEVEFLVDSCLMVISTFLFMFLSSRYKWRDFSESRFDVAPEESLATVSH